MLSDIQKERLQTYLSAIGQVLQNVGNQGNNSGGSGGGGGNNNNTDPEPKKDYSKLWIGAIILFGVMVLIVLMVLFAKKA